MMIAYFHCLRWCAFAWLTASALSILTSTTFAEDDAEAGTHSSANDHAHEHADDHAHDADGHDEAHAGAGDPNPLAVDVDLAICTAIVFFVLLGVLGKFAWPAIVAALDEREQKIANNIAAAEAKHEEAKALLAAHEAKLAAAADEVRELLEEARRDAEHTKSQIIDEAKKAAEDTLEALEGHRRSALRAAQVPLVLDDETQLELVALAEQPQVEGAHAARRETLAAIERSLAERTADDVGVEVVAARPVERRNVPE